MKRINAVIFLLLFLWIIPNGCRVRNQMLVTNLSGMYNPQSNPELSGLRVFHESDSVSRVYLGYQPSCLLYLLKPGSNYHTAEYKFSYNLLPDYESNTVIDSGTFLLYDSLYYQNYLQLSYNFPIKAGLGQNYLLDLKFTDLNSGEEQVYPVQVIKQNPENAQHYLVVDENDEIVFQDWISWKTRFRIITSNLMAKQLHVKYYTDSFPAARPPFSMEHPPVYQLKVTEEFTVSLENGSTPFLQYGREGFFQFSADTTLKNGLTIFRFHDDYPQITEASLLPGPMRYLTTNEEFTKLIRQNDIKSAVDHFWLSTAGNENRSLELFKHYFGRVEAANRYFPSYKEGWKTDRGMIYIIFGPPKEVFRRTNVETWVYGEPGKRVILRFDFIRNNNPFTFNDWELVRLPEYKNPYYIAVDYWRR
ncbi:MAG TPA: GWxTD domain-containing protein [Bacteroidales bacterium]|nr:GWxTD domain-containing protein [Bacteroidales bacterium]HPR57379.1 GWxTD domain-containing protein [Bacteroidales bacterium]